MIYSNHLTTMSSKQELVKLLVAVALSAFPCVNSDESVGACDSVTVTGFPVGTCVESSCGVCSKHTESLNGKYLKMADVTDQMVDPVNASRGKLPVYAKRTSFCSVIGSCTSSIDFLYFDAFEASYYGKELNGWAIGPAIGRACTDDWQYCSCGNVPAACCTVGPACSAYYAKQTEQGWAEDEACSKDALTISRSGPDGIVDTDPWKIKEKSSTGGSYCSSSTTNLESKGIEVVCSDAPGTINLPDSGDFQLEARDCPMAWSSDDAGSKDCRTDRCEGCSPTWTPPCSPEVATCLCDDGSEPVASPVERPVSAPVEAPVEAPVVAPTSCEPCSKKGSGASCTSDNECCSSICLGKRNRKTCTSFEDPCESTPVAIPVSAPLSPPTGGCIIDNPSNCDGLGQEGCRACSGICEWVKKKGGSCSAV